MYNLLSLCLILGAFVSCEKSTMSTNKKVVLVSIDGFRPEFYLDKKFPTPSLQRLAENSQVAIGLTPVFPTVTYPNHTTLITGVSPTEHGIYSNTRFTWKEGPTNEWYWDSKYLKVKTINDILEEKGYKTASVHWPVTVNANISYLMPEIFPLDGWYKGTPWSLVIEHGTKGIVEEINLKMGLKEFTNQKESDAWATKATEYLLKEKQPTLTLLHLTNLDKMQHKTGRDSQETLEALKEIDLHIGHLTKIIDKNTCLMIAGDHGFFNYDKAININKLFVDKGWIQLEDKNLKSFKVIAHKSGAQTAIYLKEKSLSAEVKEFLIENTKLGYEFIDRNELDKLKAYPEASFALSANEGFSFGTEFTGELITKYENTKGQHGHHPRHEKIQTGFMAYNCSEIKIPENNRMKNTMVKDLIMQQLGILK